MTLGYAFTKEHLPKDNDDNTVSSQYIPSRPHALTWQCTASKEFSSDYSLSATLSGRFLSAVDAEEYADYYDISRGTVNVHYPAYSLWKLSLVQTFYQKARFSLSVDNLFNYTPRYYYMNAPITDGTNFMVGLSVDF